MDGASDHGVFEAFYLHDLDDGELYWDHPREACTHDGEGDLAMVMQLLDMGELFPELDGAARGE